MSTAPPADRRPRIIWALLLGSSLLYFFSINTADNDLWGHLLFGRDIIARAAVPRLDTYAYTTGGHAWMDHEWLSQVLLAGVYQVGGAPGLLLLKLATGIGTFLLLGDLVRRRTRRPQVWGPVGLLAIAVLARGFAIRPQIFTYLAVALLLAVLDRYQHGQRRALWALPPLFWLWANLHGGFALGLAIVALFAATAVLHDPLWWRPWAAALAAAGLTTLTPYGPRLLLYVWSELRRPHPITEWQPARPADAAQLAFFVMLALFVVTLPWLRCWRRHGWQALLALGMGFMAVRHQRHTPVFALCAAAPLAAQLDGAARRLRGRWQPALSDAGRRLLGAGLVGLACAQLALVGVRLRRDGLQIVFNPAEYPTAAVRALERAGTRANLAVPLDWGEYALWFLAPRVKVSLDGRFATVFPEQVVADNFNFFRGAPGWQQLVQRYPTDAALVPAGSPCPIGSVRGWRLVLQSRTAKLYVRQGSAAWAGLQRLQAAPPAPGVFP